MVNLPESDVVGPAFIKGLRGWTYCPKVQYDIETKRLIFIGSMSKHVYDSLGVALRDHEKLKIEYPIFVYEAFSSQRQGFIINNDHECVEAILTFS